MREAPARMVVTTYLPYLLDHVEPEEVYLVVKGARVQGQEALRDEGS